MADSYRRANNNSNNQKHFLGKLLFFTFFLIAIPLFPSQAPGFINQTILNKFWELFHLMFIGIAVSYGLFGHRNIDHVNHDESHSYVSEMFHVSSIFEDDFEHSMYYSGQGKADSFNVKNGSFGNTYEENVVETWSSKYVQREAMVVLAQPHCGIEKYGELGSLIDHKPLGLPVRSLKSRVETRVSPEFGIGSSDCSGTSVMDDSSDSSDKSESERFSDLCSEEGKFNESDVSGSPIPWRLSSRRTRQRVRGGGGGAALPSHFRPLSVDETQFQSLKSCSLHSQLSSQSQSSSSLSPSHCNSSASMSASHSRQYSECDGTLFGIHARKCFEDEMKELYDIKKDDSSSSKEWISGYSLKFDAKRVAPSKASSRGKSVRTFRTFRSSGSTRDAGEKNENHTKGKFTIGSYEIEESEANTGWFNRQNIGCNSSRNRNRVKLECSENSNSEREAEDFRVSSDQETMCGSLSVAGSDTCEVDRKAGEFIAKFREQIRLQRTTSTDTPKGLNISGNFLR